MSTVSLTKRLVGMSAFAITIDAAQSSASIELSWTQLRELRDSLNDELGEQSKELSLTNAYREIEGLQRSIRSLKGALTKAKRRGAR